MRSLQLLLFIWLLGVCGDSVHPEENNHLYDPLKPNMLQCSNTTIEGKAGDRVILSCSTKDKMDISLEEVEWTFKDPTTGEDKDVHVYFQGKDFPHKQSDDFKVRTSLFRDQLSSGNSSLSLLVTTSHSGTYHSCVGGRLCCTVTLKVLPAGDDSSQKHQGDHVSPDDPNNGTDGLTTAQKVGLGVGITAALLLLVIIILAYCYRERLMKFCCRRNANNPQTYPNVSYQAQQTTSQDEEKKTLDQNPNEEQILCKMI